MATNKTYDESTFETNSQTWADGGSVTLKDGGIIFVGTGVALNLTEGPWKVKIDGTVQSGNSHGLMLGDSGNSKAPNATVTVGSDGTVWGNGANTSGIYAQQATDITNSGTVRGTAYGIFEGPVTANTTKAITITNNATGLILGRTGCIYVDDANHDLVVKNAGTINEIALNAADFGIQFRHSLQLTNTGDIFGTVNALDPSLTFANKVTNSGTIGNYFNPVSDAIELTDGNDTVTNTATGLIMGHLDMHGGNNMVTNAGSIAFQVLFGNGDDKMTNTGQATNIIEMGDGNNTFTNSGTAGLLTLGSGNDVVTNSKVIEQSVDLGEGNNKLANSGKIALGVTFGDGDDTATNTKSIGGAIDFGDGKNAFTNGGTLGSSLTFGLGDDTFKNTGSVLGAVNFGNGDNTFTNSGDLGGGITFGTGNDVMTNSAELNVGVSMGDGNNTFINTGILHFAVGFGAGNDLYKSTTSQGITINMGDGNDTFIGGSGHDNVNDDKGDDTYQLGAGDDEINYVSGTDKYDGGAGKDQFSAFYSSGGGLFINLDSKAYTFNAVTVAANSFNTLAGAETGKIKGFETVAGTKNADWLHGSTIGETLDGSSGADFYIGGGGADTLQNSSDSAIDTFIYEKITDSGPTKATRDTITGFEGNNTGGGDVIDLHLIDANTKVIGNDTFDFIGNDQPFGHHAGELRAVTEGGNTIIQGDVNGDGKADFSIAIVGNRLFSDVDDFVL